MLALFFNLASMIPFKKYGSDGWTLLKQTAKEFGNDNSMKLSASLSFYTVFSMVPMLVIIISLCSIFFGKEAVQGQIYWQIKQWTGNDVALQIQSMIKHAQLSHKSWLATGIGLITLAIGATGIFIEIQSSINYIWSIKAKPKRGWLRFLTNRALSFSLILSLGFLLIVSLVVNALMDLLFTRLEQIFPDVVYLVYMINVLIVVVVISVLFAVIFKVLPDGELSWKDAFIGASVTSVLFMIGKFIIGFYLSKTSFITAYGSSGAVLLILIWVYLSSVILYFGAEFTKVYAASFGHGIVPDKYAVLIEKKEVEHPDQKTSDKNLLLSST